MEENEFEMAEALREGEIIASIARSQQALAPETSEDFDGENCVDCGNEIPAERLAMKRIRCTHCQGLKERRTRLYAGGR